MKRIKLTKNRIAVIDDEDYERLNKYKWYYDKGYAKRNIRIGTKRTFRYMHWDVIGKPKSGLEIDHINGDGLDNRRENLKACTHRMNMMNRRKNDNNKSGYKGVCWHKTSQKWMAQTMVYGRRIYLGVFSNNLDAVKAYKDFVNDE